MFRVYKTYCASYRRKSTAAILLAHDRWQELYYPLYLLADKLIALWICTSTRWTCTSKPILGHSKQSSIS